MSHRDDKEHGIISYCIISCCTHVVAVQIQRTYGCELIDKIRDLFKKVPAQVQFLHVTHLLDALRYRGELLETEVQTPFVVQRQLYAVQGHFQGDGLTFTLSLGHLAARRKDSK